MGEPEAAPKGNIPPPPAELVPAEPGEPEAGYELWQSIRAVGYDLRPDELNLLLNACHEQTLIAALQKQSSEVVRSGDYYVTGSQGQLVINPIFAEIARHRGLLASLLRQMKLPDEDSGEDEGSQETISEKASRAANTRWAKEKMG